MEKTKHILSRDGAGGNAHYDVEELGSRPWSYKVNVVIAARKDPWLDTLLYHGYLRWSIRRAFHAIHIRGLEHLKGLPEDAPAIACSNHSNWWDGLVVFFLTRVRTDKAFYCMMEEAQLRHYRFFTWLGAFSVDPQNSVRAGASVLYSLRLLQNPKNMLWVFPQGRQAPAHEPVVVRPGVTYLCRRTPQAVVLPVAFRYAFLREQRPEVFIRVGVPIPALEVNDAHLQDVLRQLCAELDEAIRCENTSGFQELLTPGWSVNKCWEALVRLMRGEWREFRSQN